MDVDTVVIGSGAGGMTAALCLAQSGQKVLVLEQHYVPGGWCHSFERGGYSFSPGVHYIGDLGPGGRTRTIFEGLGVANDLTFFELNPDGFDHVQIGGRRFDIPKGRDRYAERLKRRFPHQTEAIDSYLDTTQAISDQLGVAMKTKSLLHAAALPVRAPTLFRYGLLSLEGLLDATGVTDPFLRAVLSIQCGDHGLPPGKAPAVVHAAIVSHYFNGGYYPKGGGMALPRAFLRGLKRAGGELRVRSRVERILVEGRGRNRKAVGVRLTDGTEVRARQVVSNADPGVTYNRLLAPEDLSPKLRAKIGKTVYSASVLSLFMATDMDMRAAGLDSGNLWYARHPDLDRIYRSGDAPQQGEPPGMFLTVTSLKDPTKWNGRHHTMEAFTHCDYEVFRRWEQSASEGRPEEYEAFKQQLTRNMLKTLNRMVPGLEDNLVFCELGTPLSNVHYTNGTRGNMYGTEKTLGQLGPGGYGVSTEIPGLFLCGASTVSHGVVGATMSGIACARTVLGCRTADLLSHDEGQEISIYQAEDPATWPERIQRNVERKRTRALVRA